MSWIQNANIEVKQCTFAVFIESAEVSIKFPCVFFIEWSVANKQQMICTVNKIRSEQFRINFNEELQLTVQMLYSKQKKKYLPKFTFLKLNLISDNQPNQVKMVGRFQLNLADVLQLNSYSKPSKVQLEYCSVHGSLHQKLKSIDLRYVKLINYVSAQFDSRDWQIYELRMADKSLQSSLIGHSRNLEDLNEEEKEEEQEKKIQKLSRSEGSSLQKMMNLIKKSSIKKKKEEQKVFKQQNKNNQNELEDKINSQKQKSSLFQSQVQQSIRIQVDEIQHPKSMVTKSIDRIKSMLHKSERQKQLQIELDVANEKIQQLSDKIKIQNQQLQELSGRLIEWQQKVEQQQDRKRIINDIKTENINLKEEIIMLESQLKQKQEKQNIISMNSEEVKFMKEQMQIMQATIQNESNPKQQQQNNEQSNKFAINIRNDNQIYDRQQSQIKEAKIHCQELQRIITELQDELSKIIKQNDQLRKVNKSQQVKLEEILIDNAEAVKKYQKQQCQNQTIKQELEISKQEVVMLANQITALEESQNMLQTKNNVLYKQFLRVQQLMKAALEKVTYLQVQMKQSEENKIKLYQQVQKLEKQLVQTSAMIEDSIQIQNLQNMINHKEQIIKQLNNNITVNEEKYEKQILQVKEENTFLREQFEVLAQLKQKVDKQYEEKREEMQKYVNKIKQYEITMKKYQEQAENNQQQKENNQNQEQNLKQQMQTKKIQIELKQLQINQLTQNIVNVKQQNQNHMEKIITLEGELENLKCIQENYQLMKGNVQFWKAEISSQNLNYQEEMQNRNRQIEFIVQNQKQLMAETELKDQKITSNEIEIAKLNAQITQLNKQITQTNQSIQIVERAESQKIKQKQQHINQIQNIKVQYNKELQKIGQSLKSVQQQLKQALQIKQSLTEQVQHLKESIAEKLSNQMKNQSQYLSLQEEKFNGEQKLGKQLQQLEKKNQQLKKENKALKKLLDDLSSQHCQLVQKCGKFKNIINQAKVQQQLQYQTDNGVEQEKFSTNQNDGLIDRNNQLIEENNQLANENQILVGGSCKLQAKIKSLQENSCLQINDNHKLVDQNHALINKNNILKDENQQLIDSNNKLFNESSKLGNNNIELINQNGKLIDENQELIYEKKKLVNENQMLINENDKLVKSNQIVDQKNNNLGNIKQYDESAKLMGKSDELFDNNNRLKQQLNKAIKQNERIQEQLLMAQQKQFTFHSQNNLREIQIMQLQQQNLTLNEHYQTINHQNQILHQQQNQLKYKIQQMNDQIIELTNKITINEHYQHNKQDKPNINGKLKQEVSADKTQLQHEKIYLEGKIQQICSEKKKLTQDVKSFKLKEEEYKNRQEQYMLNVLDLQVRLKQQEQNQSAEVVMKKSFTQSYDQMDTTKGLNENIGATCKKLKSLLDSKMNQLEYQEILKEMIEYRLVHEANNNNINLRNNQILEKVRKISKQIQKMKLHIMKVDGSELLQEKLKILSMIKPTENGLEQLVLVCQNMPDKN